MSVNNVYNSNKISAIKGSISKAAKKTIAKPEYMQMTGSIFNAPGVKDTTKTEKTLASLNAERSLEDLDGNTSSSSSQTSSTTNLQNISSAAEGKAAIADAEANAENVRGLTSDTQKDADKVSNLGTEATKLNAKLVKDNKKFEQEFKAQEKEIKENTKELQKLVKESEDAQKDINDAQDELETILGSNSFTMGGGEDGSSSVDNDRVKELQTIIGSRMSVVQSNGRVIYSLQRSSSRTLKQMNSTNNAYVRTQNVNQSAIKENQSTTDKVIEVATTVEQISALTAQGGQLINYAGKGLVLLGKALSGVPYVGAAVSAALISVGTVMQKVGNVVEVVGNYGQAAANITKTVAYATDGNLAGAFQSAAAALQSGMAAVQGTTGMKKNFAAIDAEASRVTQEAAANRAAIDIVNEKIENGEDLGGLTEKQARKAVSSDLQQKMANGEITFEEGSSLRSRITDFTDKATNAAGDSGSDILNQSFNNVQENFSNTLSSQGLTYDKATGKILDSAGSEINKKTRKQLNNQIASSYRNVSSNSKKSSTSFLNKMSQWGSSLQSMAAMFGAYGNQNAYNNYQTATNSNFYLDQRTLDIMQSSQRRRMALSGLYR